MPIQLFAITPRGIEDIAADEIYAITGEETEIAYRRIHTAAPFAAIPRLLNLQCADDLFFDVAAWNDIGHERSTLDDLAYLASETDLREVRDLCARSRDLASPTRFAISANFVGRRNYSVPEIKLALADGITHRHGWIYCDAEEEGALSLRLFIEHDWALLGVRVGAIPLHRRPYRATTIPGSLRPTVAAALAYLAGAAPSVALLDPLCGSGTIVIEAARMGAQAFGGDNDPDALAIARANIAMSGMHADLRQWDATRLPLPTASIETIATNLPFGIQVASDDLAILYKRLISEIARVLYSGGRAALLTTQSDLLAAALHQMPVKVIEERGISLQGLQANIVVVAKV